MFPIYPYINLTDLNLDYLLNRMKQLDEIVKNFISLNSIKYADPIQWNITTQYEKNTVVVDPNDGTAYLSVQPVPIGVSLTNTTYWTPIFTVGMSGNQNLTSRDDGSNVLATFTSSAGDWLLWNGELYKVTQTINLNEAYVVGYNITRYTVEDFIDDYVAALNATIGDLANLTTVDTSSVVNAINELVTDLTNLSGDVGSLASLTTSDKSSIVNAINEVNAKVDANGDYRVLNVLTLGAVGDGVTNDTTAFNSAIALINNGDYNALFIPSGEYLIDSLDPITVGCKIYGNGSESILKLNTGHGVIFDLSGWDKGVMCELTFKETDAASTAYIVSLDTGNFAHIHDIYLDNTRYFISVGVPNAGGVTGYMTTLDNIFGVALKAAVRLTGSRSVTYMHNISVNSESGNSGTAFLIDDSVGIDTVVISDCIAQRYGNGVAIIQADTTITSSNIFLSNCIFDGIYSRSVVASIKGEFYRLFLDNCWHSGDAGSNEFVLVQKADASATIATIRINGCEVPYCYQRGIWIIGASGVSILNNQIMTFVTDAIAVSGGERYTISNNVIGYDGSNTGVSTDNAININTASRVLVSGNNVIGTAGLTASTVTDYKYIGNLGIADASDQ